jgi:hypothetical protein
MFNNFFSENHAVYEIMWKTFGGARGATHGVTILRMRVACWVSKATHAHTEIYNT